MHEGYVKIYRKITSHEMWLKEKFTRGQAWMDLLLMVNHKEKETWINGKPMMVNAGQKVTSILSLSERWKWSRCKTTSFLNSLQMQKMLTYKTTSKYTVITIVNWELYQSDKALKKQQNDNRTTTERQQKSTNNNVKNVKNDKNNIYVEQVDKIWSAYPNKKGKAIAEKKLPELIEEHGYENIMRCVQRYSSEVTGVDKKYMKHGSTFFTTGYEDYLDSNYQGPDTGKKDEGPVEDVWNPQDYGF